MARGTRFDPFATPWCIEPIDFPHTHPVREQIIMWPTGAGKSNFVDIRTAHGAAEKDGDMLLAVQGNSECKRYVEKRLLPALRKLQKTAEMLERSKLANKHAVKKGEIGLPGKTIFWGGVNETNAQAHSVREVILDEAWMADHGLLEQFRARLHSRWNRIFCALGQGGTERILIDRQMVETEWEAAWAQTDQREWCFQCPQCNEVQRYRLHGLLYERPSSEHGDFDETGLVESTRYQCIGASRSEPTCDAVFEDKVNIRRDLSKSGRYEPQRKQFRQKHHGWHMNALGVWFESWGDLALLHAKAHRARKRGDKEPIKIFRQKRMAENYREEDPSPVSTLTFGEIEDATSDTGKRQYILADYEPREVNGIWTPPRWRVESERMAKIDVQRDHYWLVIRSIAVDGSSRRMWAGKVSTESGLVDMLARYAVPSKWTFCDSKFDTDSVYNMCGRNGWWAVQGDKAMMFRHPPSRQCPRATFKYYSPFRTIIGSAGVPCRMFFWASTPLKRILQSLRSGHREPWEVESDITKELQDHLFSEIERNGTFVAIKPNHTWDCEYGIVGGMLMAGRLADAPEPPAEKEPVPVA